MSARAFRRGFDFFYLCKMRKNPTKKKDERRGYREREIEEMGGSRGVWGERERERERERCYLFHAKEMREARGLKGDR